MPALTLTVDLDALAHNYAVLRGLAGAAEVAPVVKADGYGLGAAPCARRLLAEGARTFYVARLAEGLALREALGAAPRIYVLDGVTPGDGPALRDARLTPVLNSLVQVDAWSALAGATPLPCALHIDTGLNRLGLRLEEAQALADAPGRLHRVDVDLLISHLACANDPAHPLNALQRDRFISARTMHLDAPSSLANSAGVFLGGDYLMDQVRPGISLYGGGPRDVADARLRPVATLEAPILQVRNVLPGETIGYGAGFVAEKFMRVAIIAAGYADGVLRSFGPRGYVCLAGDRRPLLGRVSMDLIAIDVTDCAAALPGAMVQLLGADALVDDVAAAAGTTAYEILTRIGARAERRYVGAAG